jgi:hypothetical protein
MRRRATQRQGCGPSSRGEAKVRPEHKPQEAGLMPLLAAEERQRQISFGFGAACVFFLEVLPPAAPNRASEVRISWLIGITLSFAGSLFPSQMPVRNFYSQVNNCQSEIEHR